MKSTRVRHAFAGTWRQHRLNVFDGLYPSPSERGVRHVDHTGTRLRDVVNPRTGFCVTASTPLFNDGTATFRYAKRTSGAGPKPPVYDRTTGRWYDPQTGRVLRTTTDGDAALPRTRIVENRTSAPAKEARVASTKVDSPRRAAHVQARKITRSVRITDEEIKKYLARTYGVTGITLTPRIRQAARAAITHQATVKQYQADLRTTRK